MHSTNLQYSSVQHSTPTEAEAEAEAEPEAVLSDLMTDRLVDIDTPFGAAL